MFYELMDSDTGKRLGATGSTEKTGGLSIWIVRFSPRIAARENEPALPGNCQAAAANIILLDVLLHDGIKGGQRGKRDTRGSPPTRLRLVAPDENSTEARRSTAAAALYNEWIVSLALAGGQPGLVLAARQHRMHRPWPDHVVAKD